MTTTRKQTLIEKEHNVKKKRVHIAVVWYKWWRFRVWRDSSWVQFDLGPLIIAIDFGID